MAHLLQVKDLKVRFRTKGATVHAVNGISYTLDEGESLAIVGESGSTGGGSWHRWVGLKGRVLGLDRYGASGPAKVVLESRLDGRSHHADRHRTAPRQGIILPG